jgi:hypothetical protein
MEQPLNPPQIDSIARYAIATTGESADVTFNLGEGEQTLRIPFEIIADIQVSLVHIRAALTDRRRALGAGEDAGLLSVSSLRARDLPGGDLHLHLRTADKVPFNFQLERRFAEALVGALGEWMKKTAGGAP